MSITIEENGMSFKFDLVREGACPGACLLGKMPEGCHSNSPQASYICEALLGDGNGVRLNCISATLITETPAEAKIYGPHNAEEAYHLAGKTVDFWQNDGVWRKYVLHEVDAASPSPFVDNISFVRHLIIREIPTRHLTQAQFIEAHPDLADVKLVGEWK